MVRSGLMKRQETNIFGHIGYRLPYEASLTYSAPLEMRQLSVTSVVSPQEQICEPA